VLLRKEGKTPTETVGGLGSYTVTAFADIVDRSTAALGASRGHAEDKSAMPPLGIWVCLSVQPVECSMTVKTGHRVTQCDSCVAAAKVFGTHSVELELSMLEEVELNGMGYRL